MRFFGLIPILLALIAGCDQASLMEQFASREEQTLAKGYIERLRVRDYDAIEKALDPNLTGPNLRGTLEKMSALIPAGEPRTVKLVGAQKNTQGGVVSLNTTFEYQFPAGWMLANVVVEDRGGAKAITGFNVYPRSQSLEEENRFGLVGKQPVHYLALAAAVGAVMLSIYALVACIRTKTLGRKWLWILFILAGVGQFAVNWTSAEWSITPLSVQLLSASAFASPYGPWILSFSVPLGAIVFLFHQRRRQRAPVES